MPIILKTEEQIRSLNYDDLAAIWSLKPANKSKSTPSTFDEPLGIKGLSVRIGKRGCAYRLRKNGKSASLGNVHSISLDAVIDLAGGKVEVNTMTITTFSTSFQKWIESYNKKDIKQSGLVEGLFKNHLEPILGNFKLPELTLSVLFDCIETIQHKSGDVTAKRCLGFLKRWFSYLTTSGKVDFNPIATLEAKNFGFKMVERDRVLSDEEVSEFLTFIEASRCTPAAKLAYTLQAVLMNRVGEICLATWGDMDLNAGIWTVKKENTKMDVAVKRPLPHQIVSLLRKAKEGKKESDLVLGGLSPGSLSVTLKRYQGKIGFDTPFKIHDLRRTGATRLAKAGTPDHLIGELLSHKPQTVTSIYNRYDYFKERKEALQKHADMVFSTETDEKTGEVQHLMAV